jgi:comEA protein
MRGIGQNARQRLRHTACTRAPLLQRRSHHKRVDMRTRSKKLLVKLALPLLGALLLAPALGAQAQSAVAAPKPAQAKPQASAAQTAPSIVVDLSSATLQELTKLPGIGPSRAQAILDLRTRMGGFKKVDDLMRVKGIGRKTFRKLEPMLRLGAQPPRPQLAPTK